MSDTQITAPTTGRASGGIQLPVFQGLPQDQQADLDAVTPAVRPSRPQTQPVFSSSAVPQPR